MQQSYINVARDAEKRSIDAGQIQEQRHEVLKQLGPNETIQRSKKFQLRWRILCVGRDKIVRNLRQPGQMVIERGMIATICHVHDCSCCCGEPWQTLIERIVCRTANEGDL